MAKLLFQTLFWLKLKNVPNKFCRLSNYIVKSAKRALFVGIFLIATCSLLLKVHLRRGDLKEHAENFTPKILLSHVSWKNGFYCIKSHIKFCIKSKCLAFDLFGYLFYIFYFIHFEKIVDEFAAIFRSGGEGLKVTN